MLVLAGPSGCAAASIPVCIACACVGHRLGRHHSRLAAKPDSQTAGRGSRQGAGSGGGGGGVHSAQNSPGANEGQSETLSERLRPQPAPAVAQAGLQSSPQLRGMRSARERLGSL